MSVIEEDLLLAHLRWRQCESLTATSEIPPNVQESEGIAQAVPPEMNSGNGAEDWIDAMQEPERHSPDSQSERLTRRSYIDAVSAGNWAHDWVGLVVSIHCPTVGTSIPRTGTPSPRPHQKQVRFVGTRVDTIT